MCWKKLAQRHRLSNAQNKARMSKMRYARERRTSDRPTAKAKQSMSTNEWGRERILANCVFCPNSPAISSGRSKLFFRPEISDKNFSTVNIKNGIPVSCTVAILSTKFVVAAWMTGNDDAASLAIFCARLCNSLKTNREADFRKQKFFFFFFWVGNALLFVWIVAIPLA